MKALKKIVNPMSDDFAPTERVSLRLEDGVEIYEREFVHKYSIPESKSFNPRLVIIDSDESEDGFIAKTRSEIADLCSILNAAVSTR